MFAGYDNKMVKEDCVYLLMNPYWEGVWVELPQLPGGYSWHVAANTGDKKQEIYQNPVRISEERILVGSFWRQINNKILLTSGYSSFIVRVLVFYILFSDLKRQKEKLL